MALTKKQYRLIRIAKERLFLEEDDYRRLLMEVCGVASAKDLDNYGFDALLKEFERLGFVLSGERANKGDAYHLHPKGMMSPAQQGKIEKLREVLSMEMPEFLGVAEKATGKRLGWRAEDADKIIEGLKAIQRRRERALVAPGHGGVAGENEDKPEPPQAA